ncbi:hypothetical protein HBI18_254850, partial [Parastagonospora nodorum]
MGKYDVIVGMYCLGHRRPKLSFGPHIRQQRLTLKQDLPETVYNGRVLESAIHQRAK